jgi:hypothetical protein
VGPSLKIWAAKIKVGNSLPVSHNIWKYEETKVLSPKMPLYYKALMEGYNDSNILYLCQLQFC